MGRIRQFPYVEPILFVYSHWLFLHIPLMNQYMYYRISEDVGFPYLNLTAEGGGCSEETFGGNSTLKELELEVQTRSANLFTYYVICSIVPCVIISPFMGSYTDKKGRKIAMIVSLLGAFSETTILLILIYFKLSVYLSLAGGLVNGIAGYFSTMWMALMSYLSDTVEKDKLSLRMVPVVGILGSTIEPVFSSMSSRLVSSEEQGVLFAIIGILAAVGELAGNALFNTIYPWSLRFDFPGFVFVLASMIFFGLLIMTCCINIPANILDQKEPSKEGNALGKEHLEKPAKEPSQDICITSL